MAEQGHGLELLASLRKSAGAEEASHWEETLSRPFPALLSGYHQLGKVGMGLRNTTAIPKGLKLSQWYDAMGYPDVPTHPMHGLICKVNSRSASATGTQDDTKKMQAELADRGCYAVCMTHVLRDENEHAVSYENCLFLPYVHLLENPSRMERDVKGEAVFLDYLLEKQLIGYDDLPKDYAKSALGQKILGQCPQYQPYMAHSVDELKSKLRARVRPLADTFWQEHKGAIPAVELADGVDYSPAYQEYANFRSHVEDYAKRIALQPLLSPTHVDMERYTQELEEVCQLAASDAIHISSGGGHLLEDVAKEAERFVVPAGRIAAKPDAGNFKRVSFQECMQAAQEAIMPAIERSWPAEERSLNRKLFVSQGQAYAADYALGFLLEDAQLQKTYQEHLAGNRQTVKNLAQAHSGLAAATESLRAIDAAVRDMLAQRLGRTF